MPMGKTNLVSRKLFACNADEGLLNARTPLNAAKMSEASQRDEKRMMIELKWIAILEDLGRLLIEIVRPCLSERC